MSLGPSRTSTWRPGWKRTYSKWSSMPGEALNWWFPRSGESVSLFHTDVESTSLSGASASWKPSPKKYGFWKGVIFQRKGVKTQRKGVIFLGMILRVFKIISSRQSANPTLCLTTLGNKQTECSMLCKCEHVQWQQVLDIFFGFWLLRRTANCSHCFSFKILEVTGLDSIGFPQLPMSLSRQWSASTLVSGAQRVAQQPTTFLASKSDAELEAELAAPGWQMEFREKPTSVRYHDLNLPSGIKRHQAFLYHIFWVLLRSQEL